MSDRDHFVWPRWTRRRQEMKECWSGSARRAAALREEMRNDREYQGSKRMYHRSSYDKRSSA